MSIEKLDAILRDDSVPLEDLLELIWPNEPLPFDPVGKLSPEERRLGFCLREAGFAPIHIAKLEDDPFGRWEFRIRFDPDHEQPKGRRGFRKRLQNAVLDADLRPIADEVTEVVCRPGIRRFQFCTRVPNEADHVPAAEAEAEIEANIE